MTRTSKISFTVKPLRTSEWWESKFGPLFGTIYASCILFQISFINLFPFLAFVLIALLPGASFVSLINDLTDLEEDKLAGKANRQEGRSKKYAISLIFICLVIGLIVSFFLSKISFSLYLGAWVVYSLYSLPPIRLKHRGIWGVLADTLGANVFPQLFTVSVLIEWYEKDFDILWFCLVGGWSFFLGLRGIISHQLTDKKNDQQAGVKTFVQNYENAFFRRIVFLLIFPFEIIVFVLMIYYTHNLWGFVFLALYALLTVAIHFVWEIKFVLSCLSEKERLLMNEFYFIFYPISFLIMGLMLFPYSWVVLVLHIFLFSKSIWRLISEIYRLIYDIFFLLREFLLGY